MFWIENICKILDKKGISFYIHVHLMMETFVISNQKPSGKDIPYEFLGWNTLSKTIKSLSSRNRGSKY